MFDRDKFFSYTKDNLFHVFTQDVVDGLNHLLDDWEKNYSTNPKEYLAYALATAYHETAHTMKPISEYGHGAGRPYGHPDPVTHQIYYGRGYVQLTWKSGYLKAQDVINNDLGLDVDFVNHPEQVLDLDNASYILFQGMIDGWFTGKKLSDYFTTSRTDSINARRIINGTDKAVLISSYYKVFVSSLIEVPDVSTN